MRRPSKKKITEKDRIIYEALCELNNEVTAEQRKLGFGPTQIGVRLGRDKYDASSYCTLSLKKLIEFRLVEKLSNGRYLPYINLQNKKD
ncbi:hypothetical protein [Neobacillus terrae]|uniref:hypothetical protein n=1 Tax=Neobacillus terrae TaxID=3034837 RepID=UPI001407D3E3|nr:hypothetical protein [Neobacillus terrae]NHM33011.1 hypothetical protein [Neobacillus terrae]